MMKNWRLLTLLLLVSFIIKVWIWYRTPVVNPDAFEYIQQAKLLYKGEITKAKNCGKNYISLYQFLLPISYKIFKDWIFSARALSFFFAVISVVPIFFSFLLITNRSVAFLSSLMFAVNPFLCRMSSEVIKDQMFWFLINLGLLFSIYWLQKEGYFCFFLSLVSFLLSSFVRIEGILFVLISPFFLLILKKKTRLLFFYWVLITTCIIIFYKSNLWSIYLAPRLHLVSFIRYFSIYRLLKIIPHFLGGILYVFSLPFFIFFFLGIKGLVSSLKKVEFRYLLLLSSSAILLLTILFGFICFSKRYLSIFFLPSFFLITPCLSSIIEKYQCNIAKNKLVLYISIFIIVTSVFYNLKERRKHCIIYKKAGEYIARIEKNTVYKFIPVLTNDRRVDLYANKASLKVFCNAEILINISIFDLDQKQIISYLAKNGIKYIFWEKKEWKKDLGHRYPFLLLMKEWKGRNNIYRLYKVKIKDEAFYNNPYKEC